MANVATRKRPRRKAGPGLWVEAPRVGGGEHLVFGRGREVQAGLQTYFAAAKCHKAAVLETWEKPLGPGNGAISFDAPRDPAMMKLVKSCSRTSSPRCRDSGRALFRREIYRDVTRSSLDWTGRVGAVVDLLRGLPRRRVVVGRHTADTLIRSGCS